MPSLVQEAECLSQGKAAEVADRLAKTAADVRRQVQSLEKVAGDPTLGHQVGDVLGQGVDWLQDVGGKGMDWLGGEGSDMAGQGVDATMAWLKAHPQIAPLVLGGAAGGITGGIMSPKDEYGRRHRLRDAATGAGVGGGLGLGYTLLDENSKVSAAPVEKRSAEDVVAGLLDKARNGISWVGKHPPIAGALAGAAGGGLLGGTAGLKDREGKRHRIRDTAIGASLGAHLGAAAGYGLGGSQAKESEMNEDILPFLLPAVGGTAVGAVGGGLIGGLSAREDELGKVSRLKNILEGALHGGRAGLGLGAAYSSGKYLADEFGHSKQAIDLPAWATSAPVLGGLAGAAGGGLLGGLTSEDKDEYGRPKRLRNVLTGAAAGGGLGAGLGLAHQAVTAMGAGDPARKAFAMAGEANDKRNLPEMGANMLYDATIGTVKRHPWLSSLYAGVGGADLASNSLASAARKAVPRPSSSVDALMQGASEMFTKRKDLLGDITDASGKAAPNPLKQYLSDIVSSKFSREELAQKLMEARKGGLDPKEIGWLTDITEAGRGGKVGLSEGNDILNHIGRFFGRKKDLVDPLMGTGYATAAPNAARSLWPKSMGSAPAATAVPKPGWWSQRLRNLSTADVFPQGSKLPRNLRIAGYGGVPVAAYLTRLALADQAKQKLVNQYIEEARGHITGK